MSGALRIVALAALLFGAIALGACGGDDGRDAKNAYVRQVNAAQTGFANTVSAVSQEITPKSSASQDRRTLQRFQSAIEDVVKQLRGIEVPTDVEAEHKQLISAMTGFGSEIRKATAVLRNPTTRRVDEARLTTATAPHTDNGQIDAAIAAINSKLRET
jgi:hypothetical protein